MSKCKIWCLLALISFGLITSLQARQFSAIYKTYDWEENRQAFVLPEKYASEKAVILKENKGFEYAYNASGNLIMYVLEHRIVKVNSDEAMESFNKVYIPLWEDAEMITLKARTLKKNGEIVELDKDNVKELRNEETGGMYKIFAIEGAEVGGEIEYFYVLQSSAQHTLIGYREFFQYSNPVLEASFELISPENLEFRAKGYNGFPTPEEQVKGGRRFLNATLADIPPMKEEDFAMYHANRKRVEFKIAVNHAGKGPGKAIYTWDDAAIRIFSNLHAFEKEEVKAGKKLFKGLKMSGASEVEKIRAIENYIKTNIAARQGQEPEFANVAAIASNKYASENGLMRLYISMFHAAGVKYLIGLTTDRSEVRFDGKFESWKYLSHYFFFFPGSKKYLSPSAQELRYGMIPYYWTHNYGLFVSSQLVQGQVIGVGTVRFIEALPAEVSFDNLTIDINFAEGLSKAEFSLKSEAGGYNAAAIQPYFPFLPDDRRDEITKSLVERYVVGADIKEVQVANVEKNISPLEKPLIITAKGTSEAFAEKAGPKYLFKIGEVIGAQTEMYQANERQNEVENDFNRSYDRTIRFNIPEGYKVQNLEALNMDVAYERDGKRVYAFESSFKQEGSKVEVRVLEYYKEVNSPLSDFEPFKKVINAAADFNKIVLVIEKAE